MNQAKNHDVDIYKITINDPAAFSATTHENETDFNTYLFLFDSEGKAVYMNDNVPRPGYITPYLQSTLPAGHVYGPTTAGDYYLAVTGYNCLPYDDEDATTQDGKPYFDFSGHVGDDTLSPGETSEARQITFENPGRVRFTFDVSCWGVVDGGP